MRRKEGMIQMRGKRESGTKRGEGEKTREKKEKERERKKREREE